MTPLTWLSDNWVNILAFMGALNLLAQSIARIVRGDSASKTAVVIQKVASLGISPPLYKKAPSAGEGDDDPLPPSV